jgi:hypothetical protein
MKTTHCFVLVLAALLFVIPARADSGSTTYVYTGQPFAGQNENGVQVPGGLGPCLCSLDGSFTTSSPLAPGIGSDAEDETPVSPTSYSFTDGTTVLNQSNSSLFDFFIETDPTGDVSRWFIEITGNNGVNFDSVFNTSIGEFTEEVFSNGQLVQFSEGTPGTWAVAPQVPEPSTSFLLGFALLPLFLLKNRNWGLRRPN